VVASQALLGQTLFSFFTAQVQRNLRIVISMDPSSPDFQHRCQANPALFSRSGLSSGRLANVKQNLPQRHTAATLYVKWTRYSSDVTMLTNNLCP